jgi:hypothetical protein
VAVNRSEGLLVEAQPLRAAAEICRSLVDGVGVANGALVLAADPAWAGAINTVLVKKGVRVSELRRLEDTEETSKLGVPAPEEERRRNASCAATLGNSKIGAEIRSTRLLVRDIVELTISGALDSGIRKRLTEIAQLLQVYARLAELEIAAGERLKAGDVALPEDTAEKVKEGAYGEDGKMREGKELVEELSQAMRAKGHDPTPIREAMDG